MVVYEAICEKSIRLGSLFLIIPRQPHSGSIVIPTMTTKALTSIGAHKELSRASFQANTESGVLCLIFLIIIPFSMYASSSIMSRKFFTGWTVLVFIWLWTAAVLIWYMPVWQSRTPFVKLVKEILAEFTGKRESKELSLRRTRWMAKRLRDPRK